MCKQPKKGSEKGSFHNRVPEAICGASLSSSSLRPYTFLLPPCLIVPVYDYRERQGNGFSADCCLSWLKADTFSVPVSSSCYPLPVFSPLSSSSALSLFLFFSEQPYTESHTHTLVVSGHNRLTQYCREDWVYVNLVRRLCASFPFVCVWETLLCLKDVLGNLFAWQSLLCVHTHLLSTTFVWILWLSPSCY